MPQHRFRQAHIYGRKVLLASKPGRKLPRARNAQKRIRARVLRARRVSARAPDDPHLVGRA